MIDGCPPGLARSKTDIQPELGGRRPGTSRHVTQMMNSCLTDPEVLESRVPVQLDSYAVRTGSGGAGRWRGGGVRRIRFLEPMTASILSNGRVVPSFGIEGGHPVAVGVNGVERADGSVETLGHIGSTEMASGDLFVIEPPGGGGAGASEPGGGTSA